MRWNLRSRSSLSSLSLESSDALLSPLRSHFDGCNCEVVSVGFKIEKSFEQLRQVKLSGSNQHDRWN